MCKGRFFYHDGKIYLFFYKDNVVKVVNVEQMPAHEYLSISEIKKILKKSYKNNNKFLTYIKDFINDKGIDCFKINNRIFVNKNDFVNALNDFNYGKRRRGRKAIF